MSEGGREVSGSWCDYRIPSLMDCVVPIPDPGCPIATTLLAETSTLQNIHIM